MLSRLACRNVASRLPALTRVQSSSAVADSHDERFKRQPHPINPSPVRHGFVPEEWFQFFYNKTGYTGPYMFTFGVSTYLLSKELYVIEHEFWTGVSAFLLCYILVKKLGPTVADYCDKELEKVDANNNESRDVEIRSHQELIENEKHQQWRTEAQALIMEAKKSNILMQLEATYRERAYNVYSEVKKRLDYQLQISAVERRVAQKHMVDWIIKNVIKSITPDQEKAALSQCISELQTLAPKA